MPEVRRLLLTLSESPERIRFRLAWSSFRRRHQAVAKHCHATRRRTPDQPAGTGIPAIQVLASTPLELSEERWVRIAPVLPPQQGQSGRPAHDHRPILAGMFWVIRTGSSWREVPEHFGPWQTVHTRYQRWKKAGVWQRILDTFKQDDASDAS